MSEPRTPEEMIRVPRVKLLEEAWGSAITPWTAEDTINVELQQHPDWEPYRVNVELTEDRGLTRREISIFYWVMVKKPTEPVNVSEQDCGPIA